LIVAKAYLRSTKWNSMTCPDRNSLHAPMENEPMNKIAFKPGEEKS
jgi:hypothetical protein